MNQRAKVRIKMSWMGTGGAGGDGPWEDGYECSWEAAATNVTTRGHRRRRGRELCELSPGTQSSQRRIRRENERQRSLHMACTLMSVTSLTPGCGPDVVLTRYQRLSQLVRYTAFLEDATSALVKDDELTLLKTVGLWITF
ncbi:uncharacterized protein LOC119094293 [Pollicipes pollicipes]|uniref:uncharacterized protein LOC119094293 n=1 Tax=Pollicipes pollicipes TaxID=41117 RepID=UPI001884DF72|nr:uncharacterized protein LOC119094293 [Pollicipes pollicipes]